MFQNNVDHWQHNGLHWGKWGAEQVESGNRIPLDRIAAKSYLLGASSPPTRLLREE